MSNHERPPVRAHVPGRPSLSSPRISWQLQDPRVKPGGVVYDSDPSIVGQALMAPMTVSPSLVSGAGFKTARARASASRPR